MKSVILSAEYLKTLKFITIKVYFLSYKSKNNTKCDELYNTIEKLILLLYVNIFVLWWKVVEMWYNFFSFPQSKDTLFRWFNEKVNENEVYNKLVTIYTIQKEFFKK